MGFIRYVCSSFTFHPSPLNNTLVLLFVTGGVSHRCARKAEWVALQLLPGAVHRHYFRDYNPPTNAVLFLQLNRALCVDCVDGPAGLRTSAWLGRETVSRWGGVGVLWSPLWLLEERTKSKFLITFLYFFYRRYDSPVIDRVFEYGSWDDARHIRCCTASRWVEEDGQEEDEKNGIKTICVLQEPISIASCSWWRLR